MEQAGARGAPVIVAVDGPAAAGKGTLAKRLAAALGLAHLDTGLLYRATGRVLVDAGCDPEAADAALEARAAQAAAGLSPADLRRDDLRVPVIDRAASRVAALPAVRAALLQFQRSFAETHGAVLDGRDIGTVVFPNATVKLFVTADARARAERRWLQLNPGRSCGDAEAQAEIAAVRDELSARDAADAGREAAPLRAAPDAVRLDTSRLDADAALARALEIVRTRLKARDAALEQP